MLMLGNMRQRLEVRIMYRCRTDGTINGKAKPPKEKLWVHTNGKNNSRTKCYSLRPPLGVQVRRSLLRTRVVKMIINS